MAIATLHQPPTQADRQQHRQRQHGQYTLGMRDATDTAALPVEPLTLLVAERLLNPHPPRVLPPAALAGRLIRKQQPRLPLAPRPLRDDLAGSPARLLEDLGRAAPDAGAGPRAQLTHGVESAVSQTHPRLALQTQQVAPAVPGAQIDQAGPGQPAVGEHHDPRRGRQPRRRPLQEATYQGGLAAAGAALVAGPGQGQSPL